MSKVEGSIPSGLTLSQSLQSQIVVDNPQISQLTSGAIIQARVEFRSDPTNPEKIQKGVVIGGEFVEVSLPSDIKEGEEVKLQVIRINDQIQLKYIEKASKEAPSQEVVRVSKELSELLKTISISKDTINLLRAQLDPNAKNTTFEIKDYFTTQSGVSTDKLIAAVIDEVTLANPRLLEEKLTKLQPEKLKLLAFELKELQANSTPFKKTELTEARNELVKVVVELLEEIQSEKIILNKIDSAKIVNDKQITNSNDIISKNDQELDKPVQRAINKLINVLGEMGIKGSEIIVEGEKKLKEVFNQQLEILRSVESRIKRLLVSSSLDNTLDTLSKTIETIDYEKAETSNPVQKRFYEFIQDLKIDLKSINKPTIEEEQIRRVLQFNLDRLYEEFDLPKIEMRVEQSKSEIPAIKFESLTHEQKNVLKSIEVQIKSIILAPQGSLVENSRDAESNLVEISSKELKSLLADLNKFINLPNPQQIPTEVKEAIQKFDLDIKKLLLEKLPLADIETEIKKLTFKLFKELNKFELLLKLNQFSVEITPSQDFELKLLNLLTKNLKDALLNPSGKLVSLVDNEDYSSTVKIEVQSKELKRIQSLIDLVVRESNEDNKQSNSFLKDTSLEFQKRFQEILSNPVKQEKIEKELRALISDYLPKFEKLIEDITNSTLQSSNNRRENNPIQNKLSNTQVELLQSVEKLIIEVLESSQLILKGNNINSELDFSHLKNIPKFQELITLLRRIESIIPNPEYPIEHEFVEFASKLLDQIERESRHQGNSLSEQLKQGLEQIQRKFVKQSASSGDEMFAIINKQAFSNLESMIQGQEVITKLAPIMQALGEPALAIFPFLIQGFLSKIEMQVSNDKFEVYDKEKKKKADQGGEGFEQVKLNIPFPNLGMVQVGIAHRSSQILMSFAFENDEFAEFIKSRISKLENVLRNSGFDEVEINCISAINNDKASNWFEKLLTNNGTVA